MQYAKQDVNNTDRPRPKTKLLDRAREIMRLRHYSIRTERSYINWMRRYILFHDKRHPQDMGPAEIEAFLTHLAVEGKVARSTQNQAFNAFCFSTEKCSASRWMTPVSMPCVLTRRARYPLS